MRTLTLAPRPLVAEAFAPFGRLPEEEGAPGDLADLEFQWGDPHLNFIGHGGGEIEYAAGGALCEQLFRHDTHTQVLMPMDAPAILAVAPAAVDFSEPAHLEAVAAFRVARHQCLALHRGTWHWGPYPLAAEGSVRLLNVQGRRYREDNAAVWLARDHGVRFAVQTR